MVLDSSNPFIAMPILSRFFGITIAMDYQDHQPPHFHVRHGVDEAIVEIETGRLRGHLPPRIRQMVLLWRSRHLEALRANWEQALRREALNPIPPLE